ncbi:S66 peptidase family protein [Schwartzia succinivorans]|uniref:Muramoyltetrapeptide carboxypeptidase n=1 Tax=Schwartzia succinivorans DSM 10502 TaxID=1123243 RepID=A0A1M4SX02_9FIRM|nr:LD-carboxypeptidase [Schwartzia succinivorans]SHE36746.1 muramoyltetrapeptide carboxypeptidase [Schwartzia succinivorans DSM 10502]
MKRMATLAAFVAAFSFFGGVTAEMGVMDARAEARQTVQHSETRSRGSALRPGDCIGIVAPASWLEREKWEKGVRLLKKHGYRVKLAPSCTTANGFFAGTDSARASDLNHFFADDEVKAIICLRGGYGSVRVLNKLNYTEIARHPKLLIGFSDITALHTALGEKSGIVTVHGPMLGSLAGDHLTAYTEQEFFRGIESYEPLGALPTPKGAPMKAVIPGEAEGVLMGGNLSIVLSLVGTPYELKGDGALLFLEDVGVSSYQIDRALYQLWQNGLLHRVNGILFGAFTGGDDDLDPGDPTTAEVIDYYARLVGKPVIKDVPAGHVSNNAFLPFGVRATMKANDDGTASLVFDEAAALPPKNAK